MAKAGPQDPNFPRHHKDVEKACRKAGCTFENGSGSRRKAITPQGGILGYHECHGKDRYGKGMSCALRRRMKMLGIIAGLIVTTVLACGIMAYL